VGLPVLLVFSISKTLEERAGAKRHQPISLIPDGQQCHWSQSKQTSGEMITAIALRFQVTNVSDGDVKLSAIRLSRPWVKQRRVLQALLAVRHHTDNHHSFDFPVFAHQFTYVSAHVLISGAVGRPGKPMRVVVDIQDHARRWYRLTFPIVRFAGPTPNQR
jgi:hypothetical protein